MYTLTISVNWDTKTVPQVTSSRGRRLEFVQCRAPGHCVYWWRPGPIKSCTAVGLSLCVAVGFTTKASRAAGHSWSRSYPTGKTCEPDILRVVNDLPRSKFRKLRRVTLRYRFTFEQLVRSFEQASKAKYTSLSTVWLGIPESEATSLKTASVNTAKPKCLNQKVCARL